MPSQKGFVQIIPILLLLVGIIAGVFLVIQGPKIFKSKAANDQTRVEFVDSNGNIISQTSVPQVKIKLTYAPTASTSRFPEDLQDVATADGFRYGVSDDNGTCMDTAKIVDNPRGGYLAVYHCLQNNIFRVFLGGSNNILNWHQLAIIDENASQPTITQLTNGSYLVSYESSISGNHLRFRYYSNQDDLIQNRHSQQFDAPNTLSPNCSEGTPNIYSVQLSPNIQNSIIQVGFHFHKFENGSCTVDRLAKGTITNFNSWSTQVEDSMNSQLQEFGLHGNFGDRDYIVIQGKGYNLQEAQSERDNWSSWRNYLYDFSSQQFKLFNIHTHHDSVSFANPSISKLKSPSGKTSLAVTLFIPSEGSRGGEGGELIYFKEFNTTPTFPTHFRLANSVALLNSASEQLFIGTNQILNWNLPNELGQRTVYVQFKVVGNWQDTVSASINYTNEVTCTCNNPGGTTPNNEFSCTDGENKYCAFWERCTSSSTKPTWPCENIVAPTPIPSLTPIPSPTIIPTPTPTVTPTPQPLVGDINNDNSVNQTDFNLLVAAFGSNNTAADFNQDGEVDVIDFNLLLKNYGQTR